MAVHIRKLTVDRRVSTLLDGAVHCSPGRSFKSPKTYQSNYLCNHMTDFNSLFFFFFCPAQVGPHAINLAGGQAASMRIAKDIMRRHQQDTDDSPELRGEKSKTEEYIQQMRGLLWL